jgi:hypothetical protein
MTKHITSDVSLEIFWDDFNVNMFITLLYCIKYKVCIEPNPEYWRSLSYCQCDIVADVVRNESMEKVQFRLHQDGALGGIIHNSFDNQHVDNDPKATKYYTVPMTQVLHRVNAPSEINYYHLM